jgi:hypothetical protein
VILGEMQRPGKRGHSTFLNMQICYSAEKVECPLFLLRNPDSPGV